MPSRSAFFLQQVLPRRLDVRLGAGHELGLVVQGALAERQPHGDVLLLLAAQPQVPAGARHRVPAGLAVDGHHGPPVGQLAAPHRSMTAHDRLALARRPEDAAAQPGGHEHSTRRSAVSVRVDRHAGVGGPGPGVAAGPQDRPRSPAARPAAARPGSAAPRRRRPPGSGSSTRKPVRPWSMRLRRPPTSAATTGVPQAAASRATRPNDSDRLGTRQTSAAR